MAFGFLIKNTNNNVLVSDKTYNLSFVGKASYVQSWNSRYVSENPRFYVGFGLSLENAQIFCLYEYSFNGNGLEVVPFCYSPYPNYTGIVGIEKVGNVYTYYVVTQAEQLPTIYCFSKISLQVKTGWGLNVFDASGKPTFTSNNPKMLNLVGAYDASYGDSSLGYINGDLSMPISNSGQINTAPIIPLVKAPVKPAILSHTIGSAYISRSPSGTFLESGIRYNPTTKNIETRWGMVSVSNYDDRSRTINLPARTGFVGLIDGADYD
jgi:hypothetical protein